MEVISRLFNHRPAIQGEISYFVRQFEDKKNKDDELINDIWVNSRNLSEKILPLSLDLAAHNFTQIQAKVLVCCQMCEKISSQENSPINITLKSNPTGSGKMAVICVCKLSSLTRISTFL
ncbi:biogenesis of lysosome-related organelles complex 1 subunit 5-like isoform X2 [Clavelina lepadiformis]|uniref:biogenesis of lysosome-related organelles complex 1 subunit 5-like isoform X2 n=1 Tax=Clavelina lepadiformis TaxID=159417 RepID=UPI0040416949